MKTSYEQGIYFKIKNKITTFKSIKCCDNKSCHVNNVKNISDNYCAQCGSLLINKKEESDPRYEYSNEIAQNASLIDGDCISENFECTNEPFYNFNCILPQFNNPDLKGSDIIKVINSFERTKDTYNKLKNTYGDKLTLFCGSYETFS